MYQDRSTSTGVGGPAIGVGLPDADGSKIVIEELPPSPALAVS